MLDPAIRTQLQLSASVRRKKKLLILKKSWPFLCQSQILDIPDFPDSRPLRPQGSQEAACLEYCG